MDWELLFVLLFLEVQDFVIYDDLDVDVGIGFGELCYCVVQCFYCWVVIFDLFVIEYGLDVNGFQYIQCCIVVQFVICFDLLFVVGNIGCDFD